MSGGRKCVEILREIEETLRRDYDPRLPFVKQFHDWIREKLKLAEAALRAESPSLEPMAGLITSDKEVEYLDGCGEVEKVSFEGLDGCTRSTQNVGGWYDTAVWWKRNFLRVMRERRARAETPAPPAQPPQELVSFVQKWTERKQGRSSGEQRGMNHCANDLKMFIENVRR